MIRVKSILVGCTSFLLEAPRGPFYRHKGPRSRWNPIWKAILSFCRVAHRTVRCTTGHCPVPISFHKWRSRPLLSWSRWRTGHCPVHTGQSGAPCDRWLGHASRPDCAADRWPSRPLAHRTVRCTPDSPVNFSRTSPTNSRERPFHQSQSGAPDTVRCATGHCPVHHRTVRCARLS